MDYVHEMYVNVQKLIIVYDHKAFQIKFFWTFDFEGRSTWLFLRINDKRVDKQITANKLLHTSILTGYFDLE